MAVTNTVLFRPGVQRSLVIFIAGGALFYLGGVFWSGWTQTLASIRVLGWGVLLAGFTLASTAYLWRFLRWQHMLSGVLAYSISSKRNLAVYLSGLALTTSPGKLGETVRSLLLLPYGVRATHSLAAFLTDRATDVLGVCLLGALAGSLYGSGNTILLGIGVLLAGAASGFAYAVRHPSSGRFRAAVTRIAACIGRRGRRVPVQWGQGILESWALLWSPVRVMCYTFLAAMAYGTQALVFTGFCLRLGMDVHPLQTIEIFASATLLGAASMVPGGLGAMEAALVYQLVALGVNEFDAVAVAIMTRVVTLWMGIVIGILALVVSSRMQRAVQGVT